jgi:PhzF family phenazine biosynthesis protein
MTRSRAFAQVDVFSTDPYLGNPVAVVLDADGLDDAAMAAFARWTNLSETTFVLPPTTLDADYRLRIFTPGGELPFAGHPTLGSAHAWLDAGATPRPGRDPGVVVQECGAGLVELRVSDDVIAFRAPETVRSGPLEPELLEDVLTVLGVPIDRVVAHQWVANGPAWVAIELESAAEVLALEPDFGSRPDLMVGVVGRYPEGSEALYEVRGLSNAIGVPEDPVTGSLNASLAQWLHREGRVPAHYTASQGARVGRRGRVAIDIDERGDVWVGGPSTICIAGTVEL